LEIRAVEVTSSTVGDAPMPPELLSQKSADQDLASVTADGACDSRKCHDAVAECGAHAVIPPRKNAGPRKTNGRRHRAQRGAAGVEIPRTCALATVERIPPQEPCRNMSRARKRSDGSFSRRLDAVRKTAGSAPHGARLRPSGGGVPGSCRGSERLYRARHPRHEGRAIGLSGERGGPTVNRFVQQSPRLCATD
jgi:hypothetical protein